ncbi:hypothetical protein ACFFJX_14120 [Pseudarcicella hirudinis]|uniref:hypothetical protein n=1 Tax=Pseudarcicella hirudinis TaxID=1079859 RepID=UPI0035E9C0D6
MSQKRIVVVGGGAAGFFGAISAGNYFPEAEVTILEKKQNGFKQSKDLRRGTL